MRIKKGFVFSVGEKTAEELYFLLKSMKEDGIEVLSVFRFQREYDVLAELFHQNQLNEKEVIDKRKDYPIFDVGDIVIYIKDYSGMELSNKDMPSFLFGLEEAEDIYYLSSCLFEQAGLLESPNQYADFYLYSEEQKMFGS